MASLEGKTAIVTGAARGVGATIARRLAEEGARVYLGDVLDEAGEATAKAIGPAAAYLSHDVTDEVAWERIVERVLADAGRIDVLVNNAAILHLGSVENTSPEALRRVLEVNAVGPYMGMRAVLPAMKRQAAGSIVNIASIDGLVGMNGVSAYAASKWGMRGFTKAAALELGRAGIRVNCVCPAGGNPEMYGQWLPRLAGIAEQTQAYLDNRAIPGNPPYESTPTPWSTSPPTRAAG